MSALAPVLADLLATRRTSLNAAVERASRSHGAPDRDEMRSFVLEQLFPAAAALVQADAAGAPPCIDILFEMGAGLVAQRLAGPAARMDHINAAWTHVLPPLAALVLADPRRIAGLIVNAAANLGKWPDLNAPLWRDRLAAAAPHLKSEPDLRSALVIAAWQSGVSFARRSALDAAAALGPAISACLLGLKPDQRSDDAIATLRADRWWSPDGPVKDFVKTGAFTGFGGRLSAPPKLEPLEDGFLVHSRAETLRLSADRYGVMMQVYEGGAAAQKFSLPSGFRVDGGDLCIGARRLAHGLPPETVSLTVNADTLALTSPYAHAIRLYPLAGS